MNLNVGLMMVWQIASRVRERKCHIALITLSIFFRSRAIQLEPSHILLEKILIIKSHDGGNGGHFCHSNVISHYLTLTSGAPLVGQLSFYLPNDLSSLWSKFTKGIIALPVGQL